MFKRLRLALLAVLFVTAAAAQSVLPPVYPPWGGLSGGGLPYVPTYGALASLNPAGQTYVYRQGFYAPGDGGGGGYTYSVSACTQADQGAQVTASGGGCWTLAAPATGTDVRVWGCVADGATDQGACFNRALASGLPVVVPGTTLGFYVASTITVNTTLLGTVWNPLNSAPAFTFPGQSWLKCSLTVNPCVAMGTFGDLSHAPRIENLIIAGQTGTPSGSMGLQAVGGYNIQTRNVDVVNFDNCAEWGPDNAIAGISAWNFNFHMGACKTNWIINDGWPELRFIGGRAGLNGTGDYPAANAFVSIRHTTTTGGGGGPNTMDFQNYQFNPNVGGVGCLIYFQNWTGSGGFQGEFRFNSMHAEWDTYTGTGPQGYFCSDATVSSIYQLHMNNTEIITPVTPTPLFNLNPATSVGQWYLSNDVFNCTNTTLAPAATTGIGYGFLSITSSLLCGNVTFTASANFNVSLVGNVMGSLNISGNWYSFADNGNYYGVLNDTATGAVTRQNSYLETWTPVVTYDSGSGTLSHAYGTMQRTAGGGLQAYFDVIISGLSGAGGKIHITGLPHQCNGAYGSAPLSTQGGVTGVSYVVPSLWTPSSIDMVGITASNISTGSELAGFVECGHAL